MGAKLKRSAVKITGLRNVKIEDEDANVHTVKLPGIPKDFSVGALATLVGTDDIPGRVNRTDNFRRAYDTLLDAKEVKGMFKGAKEEIPGTTGS